MTRRVDLRFDNTLWAKLQRDESEDKVRIGQFSVFTAYDLENKKRPLADLVGSLGIEMGRHVSSRLSTRSAWYDESGRFGLQGPHQFEVRNSIDLSRRGQSTDDRSAGRSRSATKLRMRLALKAVSIAIWKVVLAAYV